MTGCAPHPTAGKENDKPAARAPLQAGTRAVPGCIVPAVQPCAALPAVSVLVFTSRYQHLAPPAGAQLPFHAERGVPPMWLDWN